MGSLAGSDRGVPPRLGSRRAKQCRASPSAPPRSRAASAMVLIGAPTEFVPSQPVAGRGSRQHMAGGRVLKYSAQPRPGLARQPRGTEKRMSRPSASTSTRGSSSVVSSAS
eukprot:3566793-Lingulodinium_polyedra.AAC.1